MLEKLQPNPKNPRTISAKDFGALKDSLRKFPKMLELRPIVYDSEFIVLGGNMRLKALLELEREGMIIKDSFFKSANDLTEAEKREFVIKDNISNGDWDAEMLANEWSDLPLAEWGLDVPKWQTETEEDQAPEVTLDVVSKTGDVYQLGRHRLMCGDSTNPNDVEKLMDGNKADLVFTDPPYGIDFQSHMRVKSDKFDILKNDDKILVDWIDLALKNSTGWILFCTTWKILEKWLEVGKQIGELSNMIIWDKGGGGIGDLQGTLSTDYEIILAYSRGNKIVGKRIGSVWSVGKDGSVIYNHPTQKPVALSSVAIQSLSNGHVLDLFAGSGSTLIACEQLNRCCFAMELDPKYCDVVRKRWWKLTNGQEEGWIENTGAII